MKRLGFAGAATLAVLTSATAIGQTSAIPAEFPPASFTGNQYVDSQGCAFIRAGRNGTVNWVPRVNRSRDQLCNFQPTFADATATAAPAPTPAARVAPLDAPVIEITAPPPQPRNPLRDLFRAAPAAAAVEDAPIATVASIPAEPAAAPVVAAPEPIEIAAPEPIAAPRPTITLAQACDGRFGIQAGFISASTGNPIDCGPAPQVAAATPVPVIAPTPAPIAAPVSAPEPRRITLAEACAEIGTTGFRYISAQTGQPISCPGNGQVVSAPSAAGIFGTLFQRGAVPASNPTAAPHATTRPPSSYERVWGDGRLNARRGLPSAVAAAPTPKPVAKAPAAAALQQQARVSTRTAPQSATGLTHRYVQVGTFGDHGNADRLIQRLGAAGLPVGAGATGGMKIVAVGPFGSQAELQRALQTVRGMGFSDAFLRN